MSMPSLIGLMSFLLFSPLFLYFVDANAQQEQQVQKQNGHCADGQVPTGVKVGPDGRPELLCHFPSCPLISSSSFASSSVELDDTEEITVRTSEKQMPKLQRKAQRQTVDEEGMGKSGTTTKSELRKGNRRGQQQRTQCSAALSAAVCALPDEWTVALVEVNNGTHIVLLMRCCAVPHLSEWAAPLKRVVVAPGEQFGGGPVLQNAKIVAMDVIKEVRKNVTAENDVRYVLSVFRVLCACADEPPFSPDDSAFSAHPLFSHLSGVTDAGITFAPRDASRHIPLASRERRPSFALMRKTMQKAKEWRRRTVATTTASSSSRIRNIVALSSTTTETPAATTTIAGAYKWSMKTLAYENAKPPHSLPLSNEANIWNNDENGDGTFVDDSSTVAASPLMTSSTPANQLNVPTTVRPRASAAMAPFRHEGDGRQIPTLSARHKKMGNTANEAGREGSDRRRKYTGRTTILHRIDGPMSDDEQQQQPIVDEVEAAAKPRRGEEMAKIFDTAGGYAASPIQNAQLMDIGTTESSSKSKEEEEEEEENALQSVMEQQHQQKMDKVSSYNNDELVGLLNAAVSQQSPTFGGIAAGAVTGSPQWFARGGAVSDCSGTIRNGRSDGCDEGRTPQEKLILSCGLCSCAQCACSSLPTPCNEPNCPTCPSVCQCPTECACDSSPSLLSSNSIQNGVELGESQAVEQQQHIPWSAQQRQNDAGSQYYNSQNGYGGYSGGTGYDTAAAAGGTALNAAFASLQCFSGEQLVRTARGTVRMDQLRVSDLVLSMDGSLVSFSPLLMFIHRKPTELALFVRIHTEFGHHLQLTELHLIWVGCAGRLRLTRARELRPGQCVYALERREPNGEEEEIVWWDGSAEDQNGTERVQWQTGRERRQRRMVLSRIVRIDKVHGRGIYAPLTANGNILVNDVLASCHANLAAQTLQQTFFNWWRTLGAFGHKLRSLASATGLWPTPSLLGNEKEEQRNAAEDGGDLPIGVRFLVTVLDTLMPLDSFMMLPMANA